VQEPENEPNLSKELRTRTEPNPYHQRTQTEHEPNTLGAFPSLLYFKFSSFKNKQNAQNCQQYAVAFTFFY